MVDWVWWHAPLVPDLRRQSQVDLCKSEASLVCKQVPARAVAQRNPVSKTTKTKPTNIQINAILQTKRKSVLYTTCCNNLLFVRKDLCH